MIWNHPVELILFRKLPALPCIQMHRVPQEEHLSLLQHFCTQGACIWGPGHNAECPVRYHFTSALPGFSCQLRAAEKDNAFFPVEESIRLYPVRKIRRHRQQPWPTQLDLLNLPKEMRIAVKFQIRCKVFQQQKDLRPSTIFRHREEQKLRLFQALHGLHAELFDANVPVCIRAAVSRIQNGQICPLWLRSRSQG